MQTRYYGCRAIIKYIPRPRWNFQKAECDKYSKDVDNFIPHIPHNYNRFRKAVIHIAKNTFLEVSARNLCQDGMFTHYQQLQDDFNNTSNLEIADDLLHNLDVTRRQG